MERNCVLSPKTFTSLEHLALTAKSEMTKLIKNYEVGGGFCWSGVALQSFPRCHFQMLWAPSPFVVLVILSNFGHCFTVLHHAMPFSHSCHIHIRTVGVVGASLKVSCGVWGRRQQSIIRYFWGFFNSLLLNVIKIFCVLWCVF